MLMAAKGTIADKPMIAMVNTDPGTY